MNAKKLLLTLAAFLSVGMAFANEGGSTFPNYPFKANLTDKESLQRGAKYFMNYCSGCHSVNFQRYNRTFKDLGIPMDLGKANLIFTGAHVADQMHNAMSPKDAGKWFGKAPPDLSLLARAKGSKYVYNYLNGFYVDSSRPVGFNNTVFPGASMPNPLWQLQGLRVPVYTELQTCNNKGVCEKHETLSGFKAITQGQLTEQQYRYLTADLTNFLTYISDPSALDRMRLGPWVLSFIVFLTIVFYLLKKEYWRDIH